MDGEAVTRLVFVDCETTGLDPDRHEIWEVACIVRELPDEEGKADGALEGEYVWQLPVDVARADVIALNIGRFHERRWGSSDVPSIEQDVCAKGRWEDIAPMLAEPDAPNYSRPKVVNDLDRWATLFARLTWGAHLVGAVVSFDADRLDRLLRRHGQLGGWHYHLIDVEAYAAGYIAGRARGIALTALSDPQAARARDAGVGDVHGIGSYAGALSGAKIGASHPWSSEELSTMLGVDPNKFDRHSALGDARWAEAMYDKIVGR